MERIDLEFLYGLRLKAKAGVDGMLFVLQFCMNVGLVYSEYKCPKCMKSMKLTERPQACDGFEWVCRTKKAPSHNSHKSVRSGSWFAQSKLSICDILLMTEFFVRERTQKDIMYELRLGADTVCDWRSYFREVCVAMFSSESDMIGGVDKIVEIAEIKFGKRKYNEGKHVDCKWVFGGVERRSNKCFLRVVEKRDKATLLNIIKSTILPGSTVLSDCWKSYDILKDEGFQHLAVNHSLFFKNTEIGMHTNSIEGTWSTVKRSIPSRTVTDQLDAYLGEYLWRRHHSGDDDLMALFLEGIKRVYPLKSGNCDDGALEGMGDSVPNEDSLFPSNRSVEEIDVKDEPDVDSGPNEECLVPSNSSNEEIEDNKIKIELDWKREHIEVKTELLSEEEEIQESQESIAINEEGRDSDVKMELLSEEEFQESQGSVVIHEDGKYSGVKHEGLLEDEYQQTGGSVEIKEEGIFFGVSVNYGVMGEEIIRPNIGEYARCEYRSNQEGDSKTLIMTEPYQCAHCGHRSSKKGTLKIHIKSKHTGERPHQCPHCDIQYATKVKLKFHIKSKHGGKKPR